MDNIKEAFSKIKNDFSSVEERLDFLSKSLYDTKKDLFEISGFVKEIVLKNKELESKTEISSVKERALSELVKNLSFSLERNNQMLSDISSLLKSNTNSNNISPVQNNSYPTHFSNFPTVPTDIPTHQTDFKPLNASFLGISTGNDGVPTDRQTDRQTDQQINSNVKSEYERDFNLTSNLENSSHNNLDEERKSLSGAVRILDSLDHIKKELRLKFKRLTPQEITVFSTIYQFEEENLPTDYKSISRKLNLTESSIRDYVGRLIKKGIPLEKIKVNNKQIKLSISEDLRKIATLNTILHLRDL